MSKIAIISDLHWGVRNNSKFFLDLQKSFFYDLFLPYLQNNSIDTIWILGDVLENRKQINVEVLNEVNFFFESLSRKNIKVFCLLGNHDIFYKNTNKINSLKPIVSGFKNVHLIEKYEVIEFDGLPVGFISWISPEIYSDAIQWITNLDVQILCGHFEINSFEIIKGVVCSKGIDSSIFEKFDKVFSGHFHIRSNNGIVHYIGNPYQTNWGEYGYEKGFAVFDTKTKTVEYINNPNSSYRILQYNDEIELGSFNLDLYSNKIIRIIVNECKNKKKLETLLDMLSEVCYSLEVIENKEVIISNNNDDFIPSDTMQLIQQFLETCQIDNLDKKQLGEIITKIYSEAIEKGVVEC